MIKIPFFSYSALLALLCSAVSASAQSIEAPLKNSNNSTKKTDGIDYAESSSFASDKSLSGLFQLPEIKKSSADLSEVNPVYVSQDAMTLDDRRHSTRKLENVLDLAVLKETSAYRNANKVKLKVSSEEASGIQSGLAELFAAYRKPNGRKPNGKSQATDCESVTMSVAHRIKVDTSEVLSIIDSEVSANPSCACEIVKEAIDASGADIALVADITEVAITAAPESMRMISQCAIAAMPEALSAIQAVLAKLDPNRGDSSHSAKDAKSGKDAVASVISPPEPPANPLNLLPDSFSPVDGSPEFSPNVSPEDVTNPNPVPAP